MAISEEQRYKEIILSLIQGFLQCKLYERVLIILVDEKVFLVLFFFQILVKLTQ